MERLAMQAHVSVMRGAPVRAPFIAWVLAACASAFPFWAISQSPEEDVAVVRRVVSRNYHSAEFDATRFRDLLANSAPRAVIARPNSTISGIVLDELKISESWTPEVYAPVMRHVLEMNNLRDPKELKGNQVLKLPDIPKTAEVYLKPDKPPGPGPSSSVLGSWDKNLGAFVGQPRANTASKTVKKDLQIRFLPAAAVDGLGVAASQASLLELSESGQYQVLTEPMTLTLAELPQGGRDAFLSSADRAALAAFIARPARTKPLVVVFDDSYPSQQDFLAAVAFVIRASREIRKGFGLQDAAHMDSPNLLKLERTYRQGTTFCDADCEYPRLKTHASMIRESLKDLTDTDAGRRVEVIYLPVNAAQVFSKEVLAEIIGVALLADSVVDGLYLMSPGVQTPADAQRAKPDFASIDKQVEAILARKGLYAGARPFNGAAMASQTDKGIIDSLVNFLWLYSMVSQRPHFLSMSWTAPNLKYPTLFRTNGYGIWLSAAGNDARINIHSSLRQFAARSSDPGDVLAVANLSTGCESSTFTTTVPVYGLAFPGRISSTLCGTSFSTPRVAWLLAAYEAVKGQPLTPYSDAWNEWRVARKTTLMKLQTTGANQERFKVTPWQLLQEPAP
jgi:hypothetical protein